MHTHTVGRADDTLIWGGFYVTSNDDGNVNTHTARTSVNKSLSKGLQVEMLIHISPFYLKLTSAPSDYQRTVFFWVFFFK